ncbi:MAG: hypothetical protein SPD15_06585 [Allisonella histaminiformans]|uniref:hypothetical protein n=1 Tax=Allisonella histaminiformans TaxID=209880 RepID=UPI002A81C9CA|nr:hypothetical protein [Allisonella histaminiformans]MDY4541123.1 hypothetical protein [Allisonella histaminiformans]
MENALCQHDKKNIPRNGWSYATINRWCEVYCQIRYSGCGISGDIIVTVTPSAALIQADWVKPGTHINAMGADMPWKQELDENLYKTAVAVADDREQSAVSGETQVAVQKNILRKECIAEIGDILIGKAEGRTGNQDITIFDSTGLALRDLETAALVIERSNNTESGILVKL